MPQLTCHFLQPSRFIAQLQLATQDQELRFAENPQPVWTIIGSYNALHELVHSEIGARLLAPAEEDLILFIPLEDALTRPKSASLLLAEIGSHPNLKVKLIHGVPTPLPGSSPETMFRLVAKKLIACGIVT